MSGVVAELDVAVFAVAVGRASLLCGRRFQPHFLLVGGPAVDRRFAPGLQRFRRTVLQPVEVALVIFGVFRESLHHGDEFIEEFDVGVQRDAPFPFYVGLRVRGDQQDQFVDSGLTPRLISSTLSHSSAGSSPDSSFSPSNPT